MSDKKCEVCGHPATNGVRDVIRKNNYKTGYVDFKVIELPHFYCNKHNRKSMVINITTVRDYER